MNKPAVFLIALTISLFSEGISAQSSVFDETGIAREFVAEEGIKTIQFYREGWQESYPVITQSEGISLMLEFDELSDRYSDFNYLVYHCNADWSRSDLTEQEYTDGYLDGRIDDIEPSFNTYYSYNHYKLALPNDQMKFTRSGNYILVVYRDYDPEQVVFSRRFMISEAKVNIQADVKRPVLSIYRENGQEVDVSINYAGYRIDDPMGQTTLSIYQNGIWDYGITGLKPLFINPDELIYDYQEENIFLAGNEYRMFNTRNTEVREDPVVSIDFADYYHFQLKPDEPNPPHLYFDRDDLNGRFFIEAVNTRDAAVEADYVYVHFKLKMPFPLYDGNVYIAGACTNWQFNDMNRMEYNDDEQAYRAMLLLKQGNQNYRYIFLPDNSNEFDISEIEGSHYQTNNEYLVLFYYRGYGDRYDRLAGHQVVHTNF